MFEASLAPATDDEFDRQIRGLLTSGAALGRIEKQDDRARALVCKLYQATLGDVPIDLLTAAIRAAVMGWKFPGLPEPDAIRKHASDEMIRRKRARDRVADALESVKARKPEWTRPRLDTSSLLAGFKAASEQAPTHEVPSEPKPYQPTRRGIPSLAEWDAKRNPQGQRSAAE